MIAITELSVVKPHEVDPGTLLISGAHYDHPPMFVFALGDERYRFDLGGTDAFNAFGMAKNLHPYIRAGEPILVVDLDSKVSPARSNIPEGSVALIGSKAHFVIRMNYGTAYIEIGGKMIDDPKSYDNFVAFTRWQLMVPSYDDKLLTVIEASVEKPTH